MGKIDYNETAMQRVIHVAKRLKANGAPYHGESASYYDDINKILKQIREYSPHNIEEIDRYDETFKISSKLDDLAGRVLDIYGDITKIVEQINSTNNNISQKLESLLFGTIESYGNFYNRQSLGWKVQDFGNRMLATTKTLGEAAAIGVSQPFVSAGNGAVTFVGGIAGAVWFDFLGNDGKEDYYSRIEQHINYWNKLANPDESFYKNSAGRYDSQYINSWIMPDDEVAKNTTLVFSTATNIGLAYVTRGGFKYFAAAQAGGRGASKALNEGYHLTEDGVMESVYLKTGKGFIEGKIYSSVLGPSSSIPEFTDNRIKSFILGSSDNIVDSVIDKATYKKDKDFTIVFNENGGWDQSFKTGLFTSITTGIPDAINLGKTYYISNKYGNVVYDENMYNDIFKNIDRKHKISGFESNGIATTYKEAGLGNIDYEGLGLWYNTNSTISNNSQSVLTLIPETISSIPNKNIDINKLNAVYSKAKESISTSIDDPYYYIDDFTRTVVNVKNKFLKPYDNYIVAMSEETDGYFDDFIKYYDKMQQCKTKDDALKVLDDMYKDGVYYDSQEFRQKLVTGYNRVVDKMLLKPEQLSVENNSIRNEQYLSNEDGNFHNVTTIRMKGEPFTTLTTTVVGKEKGTLIPDNQSSFTNEIVSHPSYWLDPSKSDTGYKGTNYISMSYNDSESFSIFGKTDIPNGNVILGFSNLDDNQILRASSGDRGTSMGEGTTLSNSIDLKFPKDIIKKPENKNLNYGYYNEVVSSRDGVLPDYVLTANKSNAAGIPVTNDVAKEWAAYYDIPIIEIDVDSYSKINPNDFGRDYYGNKIQ